MEADRAASWPKWPLGFLALCIAGVLSMLVVVNSAPVQPLAKVYVPVDVATASQ